MNKTKQNVEPPGKCLKCGSKNISAQDYDGGRILTCSVICEDCGASWYEHYEFIGCGGIQE